MMDALPSTPKDDMEDHAAILAAIKERKSDKARAAMQAHLARTLVKLDELENNRNPRQRLMCGPLARCSSRPGKVRQPPW
jgi:DNA-binding GntR family transcriptional regulator